MAQDIRDMMRDVNRFPEDALRPGHQQRFLDRLEEASPLAQTPQTDVKNYIKKYNIHIAASILAAIGFSWFGFQSIQLTSQNSDSVQVSESSFTPSVHRLKKSTLAEINPDYEEVENYLLTSINYEMSQIVENSNNKELVDTYMQQIARIEEEYKRLNTELALMPTIDIAEAIIQNLRLRLDLYVKLKMKLKELNEVPKQIYDEKQV